MLNGMACAYYDSMQRIITLEEADHARAAKNRTRSHAGAMSTRGTSSAGKRQTEIETMKTTENTKKGDEMIKYSARVTVERDGYSDMCGAPVQGALQCRVSCPVDKQALALDLATLMADGYTRHAAAAYMARGGYNVRGIRVLSASRIN